METIDLWDREKLESIQIASGRGNKDIDQCLDQVRFSFDLLLNFKYLGVWFRPFSRFLWISTRA